MKYYYPSVYWIAFFWLLLPCTILPLKAQVSHHCLSEEMHQQKVNQDSKYAQHHHHTENQLLQRLREKYLKKPLSGKPEATSYYQKTPALYTLPVVVHIIHNNGSENISDAQVQAGIQHLNDAFRLQAPFDGALGADIEIEFCLAKQDEFGNPTTGINRVVSTLTDHNSTNDLALKNLSRWDPTKYINIWLVKEICMPSFGCGVAGYAYYASAHGTSYDGIVNEARWFGSSTNGSKIHVHEVGHYLNLRHTFEGGCPNDDCLLNGDRVCDTPPDNSKSGVPCSGSVNTCTTDDDDLSANNPFRPVGLGGLGDQPDMHQNYMDYGFQSCQNAFTQGQKDRMLDALLNVRSSLLTSLGCENPCANPITLAINSSQPTTIDLGTTVFFTNNTTGTAGYSWDWQVNGTSLGNSADFSHTFGSTGTFTVQLFADNGNISCRKDTTIQFQVVCPAFTVDFSTSNDDIIAGTNVSFTNLTSGADTYEWFINGTSQATSTDFNFTFNTQGTYIVALSATQTASGCSYATQDTIQVTCPVQAFFTSSSTDVLQNATINFTNASLNASSYIWKIDGVTQSTDTDFNYVFNTLGDFVITLVASNGICSDSVRQVVNVSDPSQCTRRQADYWYFGAFAGLDFTSGTPTPLFDSQMYAEEGCASISNEFGDLLFYSNGQSVWDRNHNLMPNGTGLSGNIGATQSAHIVPKPGNPSIYYLFTVDAEGGANGLRYSEIDMNLNGGFGDVVSTAKNLALTTPVAEKLTALMHGNGCDVWVLAHGWGNDAFYAYLVTAEGVQTTPITSNVGISVGTTAGTNQRNAGGQLKASPQGDRLAMAIKSASSSAISGNLQAFEIYDFDNFTGIVSNAVTLSSSTNPNQALVNPYGVEFSPNGSKVYVSASFDNIYQFDLLAGTTADIIASRTALVSGNTDQQPSYYALQLAPDGKIYVAKGFSGSLGVIENPNDAPPSAMYLSNAANVTNPDFEGDGPFETQGLPGLIPNNFQQLDFDFVCEDGIFRFFLNTSTTGSSFENIFWDFGDPISGAGNSSSDASPTHLFSSGLGTYTVTLRIKENCICTQISKEITLDPTCFTALASQNLVLKATSEENHKVKLTWQVTLENMPYQMDLERSFDGLNFESIAQAINGTSFLDEDARLQMQPIAYYRLSITLQGGQVMYSNVAILRFEEITWQITPNPSNPHQQLWLSTNSPKALQVFLTLYDNTGKIVWKISNQRIAQALALPTKGIASGMYFLKIEYEGGSEVLKVMVE